MSFFFKLPAAQTRHPCFFFISLLTRRRSRVSAFLGVYLTAYVAKDAPAAQRDAPVAHRNAPAAQKNTPAAQKNAPAAQRDAPAARRNVPAAQ